MTKWNHVFHVQRQDGLFQSKKDNQGRMEGQFCNLGRKTLHTLKYSSGKEKKKGHKNHSVYHKLRPKNKLPPNNCKTSMNSIPLISLLPFQQCSLSIYIYVTFSHYIYTYISVSYHYFIFLGVKKTTPPQKKEIKNREGRRRKHRIETSSSSKKTNNSPYHTQL